MKPRFQPLLVLSALAALAADGSAQGPAASLQLGRRRPPVAFRETVHQRGFLRVKFREGLTVRLRGGEPVFLADGAPVLSAVDFPGRWRRAHRVSETRLEELRQVARGNLGERVVDHNLEYVYRFDADLDHDALVARFHASEWVEYARPNPLPTPTPSALLPGDFEPMQGHLDPATGGIGVEDVRGFPGGTGAGILVADLEYIWNDQHQDLPPVTNLGDEPGNPFNSLDHGTASLGTIVARDNGWGTTGIAPDAWPHFVSTSTSSGLDIPSAITTALDTLQKGDVILIEMQLPGPGPGGEDFVPVDWDLSTYDAVVTAVGNGVTVVEAAGNGGQNLDDPMFQVGNGGHWPFLASRDSGAIIVGGGGSPGGEQGDRARRDSSSYGNTVDLQGWGENVVTTGYGDLYGAEGENLFFADGFNGTSSASAVVAGACTLLQAMRVSETGSVLSPADVRLCFRLTGSPQLDGDNPATENIGPRPNLLPAREYAIATWVDFDWVGSSLGTITKPLKTLQSALDGTGDGDTIYMVTGNTPWTGVLDDPVVLKGFGGSVLVGQP